MPNKTENLTQDSKYKELAKLSLEYFRFNPPEFSSAEAPDLHSALFNTADVVSGFGFYYNSEGERTVRIYLRRRKKSNLRDPIIVGCKTERVYLGEDVLGASTKPTSSSSALCCGRSIGAVSELSNLTTTGTLGAILKVKDKLYGLSNNHVFAGLNFFPKGKPFNMPSPSDLPPAPSVGIQTVGRLDKVYPIAFGLADHVAVNTMDAALIAIDEKVQISPRQGTHYATPTKVAKPAQDMLVKKVGRTTDITYGTIRAVTPMRRLSTRDKHIPFFLCGEMWEVEPDPARNQLFSAAGDSGSLVVTEDNQATVGLLVSGSPSGSTFIVPIEPILSYFKAELVG